MKRIEVKDTAVECDANTAVLVYSDRICHKWTPSECISVIFTVLLLFSPKQGLTLLSLLIYTIKNTYLLPAMQVLSDTGRCTAGIVHVCI